MKQAVTRTQNGDLKPQVPASELSREQILPKILRLSVAEPRDGCIEIMSMETHTRLSLPVCDIDLLIAALQTRGRTELSPEILDLDPSS